MVNPAITAALLAAGQDKDSELALLNRLRQAQAEGSASAISLELGEKQQKFLDAAIEKGTVVKTVDGRFYLNQRALSERKEGQGYMALLFLIVLGSIMASALVLAVRSGG